MGILSTRSIVAPFIDKRNLITIVLVGVFFVVYRLSGGGVTTVPQGTKVPFTKPANSSQSASGLFFEDFKSSPAADLQKLRDNQNTGSAKSNDFLGNLMKSGNSNRQAPEPAAPTRPAQKLDDIERSLGLR
jgi:hypothetical protein